MPLEIKELHVKLTVSDNPPPPGAEQPQNSSSMEAQDYLVRACVEKVLEILKDQKER